MNPPAFDVVATVFFAAFLAMLTWLIRRYYRAMTLPMVFISFAIMAVFINNLYAPYYVVRPAGVVNYVTNYTTVVNSTTTTLSATVTRTVWTQDTTVSALSYLTIAVAIIAALIGMGLMIMVALRRLSTVGRR